MDNGDLWDMIGDLEDDLKSKILERLPLSDAVRTSELSRKWRFSWTKMRKIVFDKAFVDYLSDTMLSRTVDRVLMLHQGSIQEFVLHIPPDIRPVGLYMNGMFSSLSKKAVQKLEVHCTKERYTAHFKMPSYFFKCRGLSHLILSAYELKPPPDFQGFSNLITLELNQVSITSCALATIISQSLLIERLSLTGVLDSFSDPFDLSALALRILEIKGNKSGMLILKDTPRLSVVSISTQCLQCNVEHKNQGCSITLLSSLSKIEELTFDLPLLEPSKGGWPKTLAKEFEYLTTLNLGRVDIRELKNIMFIFCLLRSSPNLKTLNISLEYAWAWPYKGADKVAAERLEAEGKKENCFNNLSTVKISGVIGLKCETMLVKVMLSCCKFIEALVIEPSKRAVVKNEKQMRWEINRCRRPSNLVEVIYSPSK